MVAAQSGGAVNQLNAKDLTAAAAAAGNVAMVAVFAAFSLSIVHTTTQLQCDHNPIFAART